MIKVDNKEIKYHDGMTVEDAIRAAGEAIDSMTIIMVDKKVVQFNQIYEEISDDTNIKILRILTGG